MQVWGDSISVGAGATNPLTEGWVDVLGTALQARYGDGGSGYIPWSMATATGLWTTGIGFGGGQGTASATATLTWSGLRGTEIRLWHRDFNTGAFRYRVDGGGYTTRTMPIGALEYGITTITGLTDTVHTLEVEWVSGTVGIYGMEARRATGVIMQRCAQSGRAMGDYSPGNIERISVGATNASPTITSAAPGAFTSSMVNRYIVSTQIPNTAQITAVASAVSATISINAGGTGTSLATISVNPAIRNSIPQETITPAFALIEGLGVPDVIIICLGANDGANSEYDTLQFQDAVSNILRPCTNGNTLQTSPELVVMVEHDGIWFDTTANYPMLASILAAFAAGNSGALVDIWASGRRSWAYWNSLGLFADNIHPSTLGHARGYAAPIIDLLTAA